MAAAEPSDDGTPRDELSLDTPPEECLSRLEAAGVPAHLLEMMRHYMQQSVHPLMILKAYQDRHPPEPETGERMLSSFDVEGVAAHIAERGCQRIVVMCGAGISTSAGIPDFRTPGSGLYDNLQRFGLPDPQAVFDIDYFKERPEPFYELAREMWPGRYSPTPAHYFLRLLSDKGILLRVYSQNIDSLETTAGLPVDRLVAAHGNFDTAQVVRPRTPLDGDANGGGGAVDEASISELKDALAVEGEEGWRELAKKKGGLVKPSIVFFGEPLPDRFVELYGEDLRSCDLLIVLGTSLVVAPFNSLVGKASQQVPRLLVNREAAGTCDRLQGGFRFHKEVDSGENWRDVWYEGDCDSGCFALADALGWRAELQALVDTAGAVGASRAPWARSPEDAVPAATDAAA